MKKRGKTKNREKLFFALMLLFRKHPPRGERIKTGLSRKPLTSVTDGAERRRKNGLQLQRQRQGECIDIAGVMISFTHADTNAPTHPHTSFYLPVALALQATHTFYLTHTHTHAHTMVRPPIKSKVVCFYWSFALTSGLSFWRLYLSVSSWKSSVDNAQCFQLGENQTPGALAIFPAPPAPHPPKAHLPLFLCTRSTIHCCSPLFPSTLLPSLLLSSFPLQEKGVCLRCKLPTQNGRWWRRWRWELLVQGLVSINETMKVYFARMHVLNSFLCDSWLGNVSVNLIKDSVGSHYFLSTAVPDGVKVHHLHPWLVRGAAPAPEQSSFPFLFFKFLRPPPLFF